MEIVYDDDELEGFVRTAADASPDHPVLIDRFLEGAIEVDVDAVCDPYGGVFVGAVMEHIEEAGVHSGDSSCQIPPATLSDEELDTIEDIATRLAPRRGGRGSHAGLAWSACSTCSSRSRMSGSGCWRPIRERRAPCRSSRRWSASRSH